MDIVFQNRSALPALIWVAEITPGRAVVRHGPRVEVGDDWLLDGAWPGRFEDGLPKTDVDALCGYILRVKGDEVHIDPPNHPIERLYLWNDGKKIVASPSLPMALAVAGAELDSAYPYYDYDIHRISGFMAENCGSIPLLGGKQLTVIANRRVVITKEFQIRVEYRPLERTFHDFAEYKDTLVRAIEAYRDNVQSAARRAGTYGLASTVSSGYDSLALNILAAPLGWKETVTFSTPGDEHDSGEIPAKSLGMNVHCIDRHAYRKMSGLPEAEFLASGTPGENIVFLAAEPVFRNTLILTGTYGGNFWDKHLAGIRAPDIWLPNTSAMAWTDFRCRAGFINAPIPLIGGMGMQSIKRISCSPEMEPWSVGGDYDRPIPRRIIEEAGFKRGTFAYAKKGMLSVTFKGPDELLPQIMAPESYAHFQEYYRREKRRRTSGARAGELAKYFTYRTERFVGHQLKKWGLLDTIPCSFDVRHQTIHGQSSYLVPWGVEVMKERYTAALKA